MKLKSIAIGSIFLLFGLNSAYLISANDSEISAYLNLSEILPKVFSEDNDDFEDWYTQRSDTSISDGMTLSIAVPEKSIEESTSIMTESKDVEDRIPNLADSGISISSTEVASIGNPAPAKPIKPPVTKTAVSSPKNIQPAPKRYIDGSYRGASLYKYPGHSFINEVEITVRGGVINGAKWLRFMDIKTIGYDVSKGNLELQRLIKNQSYTINTITGATGTSKSIYNAISSALSRASYISKNKIPESNAGNQLVPTNPKPNTTTKAS